MHSLRARLLLSHILPLLIVIPIVGVALTYLLETQVLLAAHSNELELQAALVAEAASQNPLIWYDADEAGAFVARVGERLAARMMLLNPDGRLLATNDPAYQDKIGDVLDIPGLKESVATGLALRVNYGDRPGTGMADVLMPVVVHSVRYPSWHVIGVIRLTDPLSGVYARFPRTRILIVGVLVGGLTVGLVVGWILAFDLERPLRRTTRAITQMAEGDPLKPLPEQGPRELRQLVRAFNTLTQRLQHLERERRRLLANLVHELGRPLGALLSAIQALAAGAAEEAALRRELLAGMEGEIRRMRRLLDDLTRLYDRTLGTLTLERKPTPLLPWLQRVLGPWREAAQQKGLRWQADLPDDLPTLAIDPDRLAQALGNVVSNAVKYTPAGGTVAITAGVTSEAVWVRVRDTGPGISPEEQERIFEPFYRGPMSRRFPQGMGLGLSIARELIRAHGGHIDVESKLGEGSTFTLWLSRPQAQAGEA